MQKIIVTADDYGMCNEVDHAIDAGIENGFITTTNVMLNMDTLSNASDLRTRYPQLSVGIHWNVTTGKPISNPGTTPTLVDNNGDFWSISVFKKNIARVRFPRHILKKNRKHNMLCLKICAGNRIIGIHMKIPHWKQRHIRFLKKWQ